MISEWVSEPIKMRKARLGKLWTQEQLAMRAGVSISTVERCERGAFGVRMESLRKICEALDVEPSQVAKQRVTANWDILGTDASINQGAQSPKFAARSLRPPFNRAKAAMGREDYSLVEGGKLKPGMLVLDIRGNAKNGSVPEGEDVVEEITKIDPPGKDPEGRTPHCKLHLRLVSDATDKQPGFERTKYLSIYKKVLAKAGGQFKGG